MAKVRQDEVLAAVPGDSTVIPRYDLVAQGGTVLGKDVSLVLKNQIIKEGMAVDKTAMDECLAASGIASGMKKELLLTQPNFALFDGALVRFKLFDQMGGATTLNVNGTGAKLIKTVTGENPDGFKANMWVDVAYSQTLDQYILLGGAGGGGGLTQSINLLEEVCEMKYCKVLTAQEKKPSPAASWLGVGYIRATCETEHYTWYARMRDRVNRVDFLRIQHGTGTITEFSAAEPATVLTAFPHDASNQAMVADVRLDLIPVRGSDLVVVSCSAQAQEYWGGWYWTNYWGLYLLFPDNTLFKLNSNVNYEQGGYPSSALDTIRPYTAHNLINAAYSHRYDCVYVAANSARRPNSSEPIHCYPSCIYCIDLKTKQQSWKYDLNISYFSTSTQCAVWILEDDRAVLFSANNGSHPPCGTLPLTKSAAPSSSSFKAVGAITRDPFGTLGSYGYGPSWGWFHNQEEHTVGLIFSSARALPGTGSSTGKSYAVYWQFDYVQNTVKSGYHCFDQYSNGNYLNSCCFPGYPSKPIIALLPEAVQTYSGSIFTQLLDLSSGSLCAVPDITRRSANKNKTYWGNVNTYPLLLTELVSRSAQMQLSGFWNGHICSIIDATCDILQVDLRNISSSGDNTWRCPEDGVYKLIAVGGGDRGGATWGGGSGFLDIATVSLAEGQLLHYKVGTGGVLVPTTGLDVMLTKAAAQATYAYIDGQEASPIVYAKAARKNIGGADGASTASGGGGGGYNLVTYGGRGMNNIAIPAPAQGATVITATPQIDGNGGTAAIAGAVTSGNGYGAGGGMNQPGKDGCLVILR